MKIRGTAAPSTMAGRVFVTVHPSSILRARDERDAAYAAFVNDLRKAATLAA